MQTKRYHIIIDVSGVEEKILNDPAGLKNFLETLTDKIGMHVLKGPEIAQGIPENPGLTGFVIIDYSHISVHTFTKYGEALIDIFSCKSFDKEIALQTTLNYIKSDRSHAQVQTVSWSDE
jgi:S-adenosylmethionine decarboxylase